MNETYANVIDILVASKFNSEKMCVEIAKLHPEVFLQAYYRVHGNPTPAETKPTEVMKDYVQFSDRPGYENMLYKVAMHLLRVHKFDAIKELRNFTQLGLRESKYIVDCVMEGKFATFDDEDIHYSEMTKLVPDLRREYTSLAK